MADDALEDDDGSAEDGDIPRVFRPRRALPTDVVRPTRAEVNLSHLRHNLHVLRRVTDVPIWGVLKADAYGHGAKAVGRTLERAGMNGICVALVEEGVELREAGLTCPILVMGGYYGDAYRELSHFDLTPVLVDRGQVEALGKAAAAGGTRASVHVKLDTGMSRLGVRPDEWPAFLDALRGATALGLTGVMTHFARADDPDPLALAEPLAAFGRGIAELARRALAAAPWPCRSAQARDVRAQSHRRESPPAGRRRRWLRGHLPCRTFDRPRHHPHRLRGWPGPSALQSRCGPRPWPARTDRRRGFDGYDDHRRHRRARRRDRGRRRRARQPEVRRSYRYHPGRRDRAVDGVHRLGGAHQHFTPRTALLPTTVEH